MKLNKSGTLARFYLWFNEKNNQMLPENFCVYFWGLVGRVAGCILVVCLTAAVLFTLLVIGFAAWAHKGRAGTLLGVVAVTALVVYFSKRNDSEILSEAKTILKGKVDAVRNRYCPRIEWQDAATTKERE